MATDGSSSGENRVVFNGINGATGGYLVPPMSAQDVSEWARSGRVELEHLKELKRKARTQTDNFLVRYGVVPESLEEAGWGVIFARDADPAVKDALRPLLELRKSQATKKDERRYQEYVGRLGYRTGEGE